VGAALGLPLGVQKPVTAVPMVATLISFDNTPVGDWKKPAGQRPGAQNEQYTNRVNLANEEALVVLTDYAACLLQAQAVTTLRVLLMQVSVRAGAVTMGCSPLLLLPLASHAAGKHPDSFALFHRVLQHNMTASSASQFM
jgi:hypothetical protein